MLMLIMSCLIIIFGIYVIFVLAIKIIIRTNMDKKCTEKKEGTLIEIKAFGQKEDYEIEDSKRGLSGAIERWYFKTFYRNAGHLMDIVNYIEDGETPLSRWGKFKQNLRGYLNIKNWDRWERFTTRGKCTYEHIGRTYTTDFINLGGAKSGLRQGDTLEIYVNLNNPEEAIIKSEKATRRMIGQIVTCGLVFLLVLSARLQIKRILDWDWSPTYTNSTRKVASSSYPPVAAVTAKPEKYNMVDTNYFGVIKVVPDTFSKPIYAGNSEKSGKCTFYHKDMHEKICVVDIKDYTDEVAEKNSIKFYMEKELEKEAVEFVNEYTLNKNGIEVKFDKLTYREEYLGDFYYMYSAHWFHGGKRYLIMHYTSLEQVRDIATSCIDNMK